MANEKTVISYKNFTWYDFIEPNKDDVEFLSKRFRFHPLDLEDCLTENQRPKIDEYENYLFIVLHFPVVNSAGRIVLTELDIFIGQNFFITLHDGVLSPLKKIRAACERLHRKRELLGRGSGYLLYELVSELFDYCFPMFDTLSKTASRLEQEVFENESARDILKDIMFLKKDVINFRRILQPERPVISALEHKNKKFLPENLEVYFDDIVDKIEKLWGSLDALKEVMDNLHDTNENIISHTTGNTIRILTIFSVIMLPLTLISGIFGMNVPLPEQHDPYALIWILLGMLTIAFGMVLYFKRQKWL